MSVTIAIVTVAAIMVAFIASSVLWAMGKIKARSMWIGMGSALLMYAALMFAFDQRGVAFSVAPMVVASAVMAVVAHHDRI